MKKNNKELVIRVFDENGPNVQDAILKAFRKYLDLELKKTITYTQVGDYKLPNLTIKETNTQYLYSITHVHETYVTLNRQDGSGDIAVTFKELFDNFTFNNDKDYIIGIKINDEEE